MLRGSQSGQAAAPVGHPLPHSAGLQWLPYDVTHKLIAR